MKNNIFSNSKLINTLAIFMVLLLILEYILGIYTNIFIEIPKDVNGWQFASSSLIIISHIMLGVLLLITAIAILVISIKTKKKTWIFFSVMGLVAILISLSAGSSFIDGQADINSFIMSVGLGMALLAYAAGNYFSCILNENK